MNKHDILSVVVHKHDVALTNTMRRFAHELIETAIKDERAKIVAWLLSDRIVVSMDGSAEDVIASAIETGDHWKALT